MARDNKAVLFRAADSNSDRTPPLFCRRFSGPVVKLPARSHWKDRVKFGCKSLRITFESATTINVNHRGVILRRTAPEVPSLELCCQFSFVIRSVKAAKASRPGPTVLQSANACENTLALCAKRYLMVSRSVNVMLEVCHEAQGVTLLVYAASLGAAG